jgi:hypothetical protein
MDRKLVFKNMPGSWHTGTDFKKVQLTRVSWDNMPNHALAYVFFGHVNIDFDGSPTAYGPKGIVPEPDDDLDNAGNETLGYFGVVAYSPDHPLVRDGTILIDQRAKRLQGKFPVVQQAKHHDGVPIAREKKTTNLVWDPSSTAFCLLETRLRGAESRNRIRERLSRIKSPQDLGSAT